MTYYRNFGKRLVKSPKVYFTDVVSCNVIYAGDDWPLKGGGRYVNFRKAPEVILRAHDSM